MNETPPAPPASRLPAPERGTTDGIEFVGEETGSLFTGLLNTYEQRGFERGYRQAVSDLLSSLLWVTEEHLRTQPPAAPAVSPADARRVLYHFEERLERHIHTLSPNAHYVSDGLGI